MRISSLSHDRRSLSHRGGAVNGHTLASSTPQTGSQPSLAAAEAPRTARRPFAGQCAPAVAPLTVSPPRHREEIFRVCNRDHCRRRGCSAGHRRRDRSGATCTPHRPDRHPRRRLAGRHGCFPHAARGRRTANPPARIPRSWRTGRSRPISNPRSNRSLEYHDWAALSCRRPGEPFQLRNKAIARVTARNNATIQRTTVRGILFGSRRPGLLEPSNMGAVRYPLNGRNRQESAGWAGS